jgi:aspartyl-tRNA(Asn)/glutamyl-tRNA(Gln) amidotransferase subunit B
MEEGSLRCDANVSLRRPGSAQLGTRTELKNINSFRNVQRAIEHEIGRQAALLRAGQAVVQETRGWDAEAGLSRPQRSKEEAQDYRYFPEPDLPPLVIDPAWLDQIRAGLPLLPLQRRARYQESLGLPPSDAAALTAEPELCEYFDAMLAAFGVVLDGGAPNERQRSLAKLASNWLLSELLGALHRDGRGIAESPVGAAALAELVRHVADQVVSGRQAKEVFARMYATGSAAAAIIEALGLRLISDTTALEAACRQVVEARENHKQVQGYARNPRLLGYFVGKVMAATGGQAHPERLSDILRRLLADKAPPE